jgi:hypothetical protein
VCLYVYPPIVARQRLGRNVTAVTNTHATIHELLYALFSMWPVSYQRKQAISSSQNFLFCFCGDESLVPTAQSKIWRITPCRLFTAAALLHPRPQSGATVSFSCCMNCWLRVNTGLRYPRTRLEACAHARLPLVRRCLNDGTIPHRKSPSLRLSIQG